MSVSRGGGRLARKRATGNALKEQGRAAQLTTAPLGNYDRPTNQHRLVLKEVSFPPKKWQILCDTSTVLFILSRFPLSRFLDRISLLLPPPRGANDRNLHIFPTHILKGTNIQSGQ